MAAIYSERAKTFHLQRGMYLRIFRLGALGPEPLPLAHHDFAQKLTIQKKANPWASHGLVSVVRQRSRAGPPILLNVLTCNAQPT
jgi:hypothetical protein